MATENLCLEAERSPLSGYTFPRAWTQSSVDEKLRPVQSCRACSEPPEGFRKHCVSRDSLAHSPGSISLVVLFVLWRHLYGNVTFGSSQTHLPGVNSTVEVIIFYGKLSEHLDFNIVLDVTDGGDCVSFLCAM